MAGFVKTKKKVSWEEKRDGRISTLKVDMDLNENAAISFLCVRCSIWRRKKRTAKSLNTFNSG
jgi:hypothetical protein